MDIMTAYQALVQAHKDMKEKNAIYAHTTMTKIHQMVLNNLSAARSWDDVETLYTESACITIQRVEVPTATINLFKTLLAKAKLLSPTFTNK
jgi:hypothetical protein